MRKCPIFFTCVLMLACFTPGNAATASQAATTPSRVYGLMFGGQSNMYFFQDAGACGKMGALVNYLLGGAGYKIMYQVGCMGLKDEAFTICGGNALYGDWFADNVCTNPEDWRNWPAGYCAQMGMNYINNVMSDSDRSDTCAAVCWLHTEYDSDFPYWPGWPSDDRQKALVKAAWMRWMTLVRSTMGRTATNLPFFVWSPIPYGRNNSTGIRALKEIYAELQSDSEWNLQVCMPHTGDMNNMGATGPDADGTYNGGDWSHKDGPDFRTLAIRGAFVVAKTLSDQGKSDTRVFSPALPTVGPRAIHAYRVDNNTLRITVAHDKGTNLKLGIPAASGAGWGIRQKKSSNWCWVNKCEVSAWNELTLTLASDMTDPLLDIEVWWCFNMDQLSRDGGIYDNWSQLPKPAGYEDIGTYGGNINFPLQTMAYPLALSDKPYDGTLSEIAGVAKSLSFNLNCLPNPFASAAHLSYSVPVQAQVILRVCNTQGQVVKTVVAETQKAGRYQVRWDGTDNAGRALPCAVYMGQLTQGRKTVTKKLVWLGR